jgi:hypothetical protein
MKTFEIYFKEYINTIQKIVNNPRPSMDEDIRNIFLKIHKYDIQNCEQPKAKYG